MDWEEAPNVRDDPRTWAYPKNFSGTLLPHRTKDRDLNSVAKQLFKEYKKKTL